jgi:nitroreductase
MELQDVVRCSGTTRYFKPDPIADPVLRTLFEAARWAPQGGNRQPVRWIVVRDERAKRQLRDWYLEPWKAYMAGVEAGRIRVEGEKARKSVADADHMAEHLHEAPVLLVVCAVMADITTPDAGLDRPGIVGGASVYPAVQNLLLTAREMELGAAMTTLLCAYEAQIAELLGLPEGVAVAGVVALGWPARPLLRKLSRRPVDEVVYADRYGVTLWAT